MDNKKNTNKSRISKRETNNSSSSDVYASCSFSSLGLHPKVCDQLKERLGFETPTQVQAKAIPVVLSGRHVLVNAATGTGKTIAYLAPIIHHLQSYEQKIQRVDGTFDWSNGRLFVKALVLVPTHELCMQVYEILVKLLHRFHWIVPGYLMGGENRSKEKARLRKGMSILIATPGRLLDHLKNTSSFVHTNLRWIIFDEADRILELGYGKDIEEIINRLGTQENESLSKGIQKQNLLLSATLNEKVNQLAKISLENPVLIGIDDRKRLQDVTYNQDTSDTGDKMEEPLKMSSSLSEEYKLPDQLIQRYIKVSCGSRLVVLLSILKHLFESETSQKIVVFFSTCDAVDFHHSLLKDFKWSLSQSSETEATKQLFLRCNTLKLHGNMNNVERKTSYQSFKTEKSALLLSTDVAARGLDIPKIRCIIQYDSPGEATEYVHRVGRTARLGANGEAMLFLQPVEIDYLKDLEKHGVILQEYPLLKVLATFPLYSFKNQQVRKFDSIEMHPWVLTLQRALESFISSETKMRNLAQDAFCSWVRAYTAHRGDLKNIFTVKKLHLGHVAKSFALKEQPSLVNKSIQKQLKKRKRNEKQMDIPKKKKKFITKR